MTLCYALLGVICRVRENSWVHTPEFTIKALDHDAILVCLKKVFIQENVPNSMEQLSFTVR